MTAEGRIRRNNARLLMWDGASMFDSVNQLMNMIQEAGFGYHEEEFRADTRNIFNIVNQPKSEPGDWQWELYPRANMAEVTWKSDKLFMVHGLATYEDEFTGELYTRRVSLYTDNYAEGFNYFGELQTLDYSRERYKGQVAIDFQPTVMWHKYGASFPSPFELKEL